jgi:hypothetical protein
VNEHATEITEEMMSNGISMMEWYLTEMHRVKTLVAPTKNCARPKA